MPFVVGETIGPYRILEQLGRGGMATVFKAYHAALDRYVAIKALHPAFLEDPNFHARFQREARVVAKLEHPNIVPIYDFAEYEGRPYLVMKYIEGDTLKARLGEGPIEQAELIRIVDAVGSALTYAHQKGILHRDVKPSNVLLGQDGSIYLADFGLARIAQAGESTLSSDMMLGTPQYISPEQAMGLGELDERTDIYSFGVMLYELVVGKVPFSADTPFSIIHDHIYTPLPLPSLLNPDVPEAVERVLLKALAKERADRYPSAEALAQAFVQAVSTEPGASLPLVVDTTPAKTHVPEQAPEIEVIPEVVDRSEAHSTQLASPQSPAADSQVFPGVVESPAPDRPRRRFRWWFVPLGLVMFGITCICMLIGLRNLIDLTDNGASDLPPASEQTAEAGMSAEPFQGSQPSGELDALPLAEAQAQVDENPDDPDAWLDLAWSQMSSGKTGEAEGALNQALELAGDDPGLYYDVAADLAGAGLWVESAHVYLLGLQRFEAGEISPDVVNDFHEAVYWAAEYPEAEGAIPIQEIARVDPPMERVAKARYLFYFGDQAQAQQIVEQVMAEIKPGMSEAMYLQAEIFYDREDYPAAYPLFFELQAREDTPDWIRAEIEPLLEEAMLMSERAQAQIDADPENPYLYLPLYEIYLGQGQSEKANAVLQQALSLAKNDLGFVQAIAEMAARNGAWLDAARLFARQAQISPDELTPELSEKIIQALYYGASEAGAPVVFGEMEAYLPEGERGVLRGIYRDALLARYKLYFEDVGEAQALIEDVVRRAPNLALPQLVQAEVYLFNGNIPGSEALLQDLQENRSAPPWIRDEAQKMLEEIKP